MRPPEISQRTSVWPLDVDAPGGEGDSVLPESTTLEAALADLPKKIRVHALAKRLGMSSKDLIAALAARGITVTSAQSSVTDEVATAFVQSLSEALDAAEVAAGAATDTAGSTEVEPAAAAADVDASATQQPAKQVASPFMNPFTAVEQAQPMSAPLQQDPFAAGTIADPFAMNAMLQSAAPIVVTAEDMGRDESSDDDSDEQEGSSSNSSDEESSQSTRRRRRRGRRGRGRGRGDDSEGAEDNTNNDAQASADSAEGSSDATVDAETDRESGKGKEPAQSEKSSKGKKNKKSTKKSDEDADNEQSQDEESSSADSENSEEEATSTHRRRRRRRRSATDTGDESSQDDPPNTVVHERGTTQRRRSSVSDEVQGISGSTRLEAKRQRRREGRDNARNRIPVLSEAEFLARRESVERTMVVREKERSDHPGVTTQVGVLEDNILVEHFVTSDTQASMVGNIYLGRVQNVLPSMEAAFIDIGRGRNAVLYAGEVNWAAAGLGGKSRKIEQALSAGDMVVVQVSKDPIAHKGARLTTQISMAGRYLVYVPDGSSAGISRKLPDTERKRLKSILKNIVPGDAGVIIRTAAEGASEEDLKRDIDMLHQQWLDVQKVAEEAQQKADGKARTLHEEPTMLVKVVRDLFNDDFKKLVVEGERAYDTITGYVQKVAPQLEQRLERWENTGVDVFQAYRIDEQLAKALDRKVWLPSGGTLVIDRTEAMTVVDVNTGKFTGSGGNLEETVTRNNLEAAEEIVRQLRLRDIGGIVIIDFIDMVLESNRDLVLRRLREALGRDRTRHQVSEVTSLGLVQLTRKRLGTGLLEAFSQPCPHCSGTGYILQEDPVEAITSGNNADDQRGGRRRRGRNSDKQEKNDNAKAGKGKDKNAAEPEQKSKGKKAATEHQGPNPSEHPMMKAMGRKKGDESGEELGEETDTAADTAADSAVAASVEPLAEDSTEDTVNTVEETADAASESTADETDDEAAPTTTRRRRRRGRRQEDTQRSAKKDEPAEESTEQPADKSADKPVKKAATKSDEQATRLPDALEVVEQSTPTTRKRRGARRATQAAGSAQHTTAPAAPMERKEVVAGVLAAAPIAVSTDQEEKAPRRPRRRATRSS